MNHHVDQSVPMQGTQEKSLFGPPHIRALIASISGYAMDGFDLLILGFMLSLISADLGLTSAQAGSLVTWTLVGGVAGGIGFGIYAPSVVSYSDCYWVKRVNRRGVVVRSYQVCN